MGKLPTVLTLHVVCTVRTTQLKEKEAEEAARNRSLNILTSGRAKQGLDDDVLVVPRDLLRGRSRRKQSSKVVSVSLAATRKVIKQAHERSRLKRMKGGGGKKHGVDLGLPVPGEETRSSLCCAEHVPQHRLIAVSCDDGTITMWRDDTCVAAAVVGGGELHNRLTLRTLRVWFPRQI